MCELSVRRLGLLVACAASLFGASVALAAGSVTAADAASCTVAAQANCAGADLRDANLAGADLTGINLAGADLRGADLARANLTAANLSGANLSGAQLDGAKLTAVNATGASIRQSVLAFANLHAAILRGANLHGSQLDGAVLTGADLQDATLTLTNFAAANLTFARLGGAMAHRANFWGTNLTRATLSGADIRDTSFVNAHFSETHMSKTSWTGAILWPSDFSSDATARGGLFASFHLHLDAYGSHGWCNTSQDRLSASADGSITCYGANTGSTPWFGAQVEFGFNGGMYGPRRVWLHNTRHPDIGIVGERDGHFGTFTVTNFYVGIAFARVLEPVPGQKAGEPGGPLLTTLTYQSNGRAGFIYTVRGYLARKDGH